ncbi:MAG TPA: NAD(P)H-dependent oxidoreductase subunit E [Bacteroidales bacterium]|nr:NAD(P)H-dependent oxidoreductase subunit E [Bacteroidales bacterium]
MTSREIISKYKADKDQLLMILHEVQNNHPQSYISEEDIILIAKHLNTTKAAVYGVVEYYSMFSSKPRGKHIIRVCKSPMCRMLGSADVLTFLQQELGVPVNHTSSDGMFTLELSECLGHCDKAPVMMIDEYLYSRLSEAKIRHSLDYFRTKP